MALARSVYAASQTMPKEEVFGLRAQIRSAAVSIPSNIAEGYCRNRRGEYLQFLGVAAGSLGELETQLILAADFGHLDYSQDLQAQVQSVGRLLSALRRSLAGGRPSKAEPR